jgi:lysozyme family protein
MHTIGTTGGSGSLRYTEPPYDGSKIGRACTPPSTSGGTFTNKILTTGRYKKYPAFEKAMITKFRTEGTCGELPGDAGGYTCYGVSSKFFPQVKNKNFSRADAEDIAYNSFWHKHKIDKLPDAISGDVFMALWGTGSTKESIGVLQRLLGVEQTKVVDAATINAAKNYQGDLRTQYLNEGEKFFKRANPTFRQGWLNALKLYRANGCHTIAQ